jgi:hypothetical protein
MTKWMRADLLRFCNVVFLDAQQRQFNTSGFPYISPCMVGSEDTQPPDWKIYLLRQYMSDGNLKSRFRKLNADART